MLADVLVRAVETAVGAHLRKRDFDRRLRAATERAVDRFRDRHLSVDRELTLFLLDDAPVLDLPSVGEALRQLVLYPARSEDQASQDFAQVLRRFAPSVNEERVDRALQELVRCLRDELQHLPELQPSFALMYQQQQLEVLRATARPTSPSQSDRSSRHNLPHRTYHRLVGRATELELVLKRMRPEDRTWVVVIDGIGGVGKTSLALEAAYQLIDGDPAQRQFDAAIWVSAKQTLLTAHGINTRQPELAVLRDLFTVMGSVLGRGELIQMPFREQRAVIGELLSGDTRVLLVLDNLETVDDDEIAAFLRDLPQPTKAIVTSRHRLDVAYSLRLSGLPLDEAAQLIAAQADQRDLVLSQAEASALTRKTGGIPLAIVWSLSLMNLGHSVESVLRRLGSGHSDIAAFCFRESVRALEGTEALWVLAAIAMFEDPVDRTLLGRAAGLGEDVVARDDGIQTLIQLSLIDLRAGMFTLLPLTRTYVERLLDEQPDLRDRVRTAWLTTMLEVAAQYRLPDPSWRDLTRLRSLGPHLHVAYGWARDSGQVHHALALAGAVLADLDAVGRWDDLLATCAEVESYASSTAADDLVLHTGWYQNWIYAQRGEFDQAWLALDRVSHLPTTPEERLRHQVCCAQTCRREGRHKEAAAHLDQAQALVPDLTMPAASGLVAHLTFEAGKLARDLGDWDAAERAFRETSRVFDPEAVTRALADGETPTYDPEWAVRVLGNLGVVEHRRDNLASASALLQRAVDFTREHGSASNLATLLIRLADVQLDQGRVHEAATTLSEATRLAARLGMREEVRAGERLVLKHRDLSGEAAPRHGSESTPTG
ncbi:tetratricopeptide repeat protein [Micromonospora taraxaci]|uniref:tetratricopeptide repeat protein n=1 Tax=Micromonospora taraxaci TaxID=1316803 RepID=UPI0033A11BD3